MTKNIANEKPLSIDDKKIFDQFLFREFCRQMSAYKYINTMDDSGLENSKKVKRSYKPHKFNSNFVITRGAS